MRWHPKAWRFHYSGPQTVLPFYYDEDDGYLARIMGEIKSRGSFAAGEPYTTTLFDRQAEFSLAASYSNLSPGYLDQLAWEHDRAERRREQDRQATREWEAAGE